MACVRKDRGMWVVDYRDEHKKRHICVFRSNPATDSGRFRPPHSDANQPPFRSIPATLWGLGRGW